MVARFGILQQRPSVGQQVEDPPEVASSAGTGAASSPDAAFVGPLRSREPVHRVVADTLDRDDSIYLSLKRHRVSERQIVQLDQALQKVFASRSESRPGDRYTLLLDTHSVVRRFEYVPRLAPERPILVELRDGQLVGQRLELPLTVRTAAVEVRIDDNLANAISAAGEGDALTDMLADDIFGAVVDFRRDPRRGDRIGLVFEKLYKDDRFVRYGRILLARYTGQEVSQLGVFFSGSADRRGYYDAGGKSLQRMFLLYALPYRRITSGFNPKRFHPVLKRTVPHLGTDYGAPVGTAVHATARGRVTHAGWKGSLGKAVIIQHPNGYVTRYGHLSRVLVKKGQYVQQKDRIGKVGSTGRVTGPHLHYEVIKDGWHLDPEKINKGTRGNPLQNRYLAAFQTRRDSLLSFLERNLSIAQSTIAGVSASSPDGGD